MRALDRLKDLPDWPARMTAPVAAAYMDVSPNTFTARYRDVGRQEGGKIFWARVQLDRIIAEQFDLGVEIRTPPAAPMSAYDRWKAGEFGGSSEPAKQQARPRKQPKR